MLEVIEVTSGERRALKLAAPATGASAMLVDEFAQLARLAHPSLPRVFDVGVTRAPIDDVPAGAAYFVAEWVAGGRADARPWDAAGLWSAAVDLAGALAVIHASGLVHGDVAPQNVLVGDGRVVLVDLGLAGGSGARGTPDYMAPEAFAGIVDARGDLWGLGATLVRLATGSAPFGDGVPGLGERVRRAISAARPTLPLLPAPLADLIRRLLARDAEARPASAVAVLAELDQIAAVVAPAAARRAQPAIGPAPAPASWPGAGPVVDAIARGLEAGGLQLVTGGPASGARALAEAALRRWRVAAAARGDELPATTDGDLDAVAAALGVEAGPGFGARAARAIRAAAQPVLLALGELGPTTRELLAALGRAPGEQRVVVLVERAPAGTEAHAAPALDEDGVAEIARGMLQAAPPPAWTRALHAASAGQPLAVIELLRGLAGERDPLAVDWSARATKDGAALRDRALGAVSAEARDLALAVAVWGGRARLDLALATVGGVPLAAAGELEAAGLAHRVGADLVLDRVTAAAAERLAGPAAVSAAAGHALARAATGPLGLDALAALLGRAALDDARAERACAVAAQLLERGQPEPARVLAERAGGAPGLLVAARAAAATGAYADAQRLAHAAAAAGADAADAELVVARAAQRAGELDTAEATLGRLHAAHPTRDDVTGAYARLLVTRARYAEAAAIARGDGGPVAGLRAEALGLAALYQGELDDADRAFAALELGGTAAAEGATIGRALSLRGMVAQHRGQLALAGDRYREAARRLDEVGEIHAAATAELNLGTVLAERGHASESLPRLAAAARVFAALDATTESLAAELARANSLLAVGQVEDARGVADATVAAAAGAPHLRAFAMLVAGDARVRLGDGVTAERAYRGALELAQALGDAQAQLAAHVALAEAGHAPADEAAVTALVAGADDRDRWTLAAARLHEPTAAPGAAADLARAVAAAAARADGADRLERAFRAHALAARLAQRGGDTALARAEADHARTSHAAITAAAAPAFRAALAADPELARLPGPATPPVTVPSGARGGEPAHLRRLLALSRRLNSTGDVDRILDEVIDTAIELSAAERGFLLLRHGDELVPVVSRNFATADLEAGADTGSVSRSIAERAAQTGEPVVTIDAGRDERFDTAASVAALRLRSVLAVPLRQRGVVIGCIYVDHRLRGGAFDDDAAGVLGELADIAAIAIDNARLTADLRRTKGEVDALATRLSAELAERDAELVRVKADLPDRERLRHRYERIAGRSPAMLRMLDIVDRAAATSLPVVIVGESGTGKELVARALHDHGPRAAAAFVAINCSAVPEALLESELFGHARGAFTGADRDRRGLFEVADGGTLFLDEIADTSPGMQAKLLRVLQDGVIRRVGDTATRHVDVRVVAAAQRPLAELAAAGRFREDLRFRLEVITVPVPPLRERDGDIPVLVERLLAQLAPGKVPRLTRAALRALSQHRWPGNVRELENALARGIAMGGDTVDVGELPEAIGAAAARPEPARPHAGDDLLLKPALHATEQAYIAAAMGRSKQNQTVAARLLGLSRFGLQKKLARRAAGADEKD